MNLNVDAAKAKSIFLNAVELCRPDDWPSYLDRECAGNAELRSLVERLLAGHQQEVDLVEHGEAAIKYALPTLAQAMVQERPGTLIGPYKLIEQIGEGGMGVVYMAAQKEPVRRTVAVKILKPGMDTKEVVARFEAERQALALMDHPNIARVLDAGTTESGRPYFVMELVRGVPINEYCDRHKLDLRQRLQLFFTVCHAVQHAHEKEIIHRDLKPSNILVERHDVTAVPKVIDFGVAKATNRQLTEHSVYTGFSQMLGTPLYMSPEQAELSGLDVDTRTDIYSLGVLLYELLTGTTPFASETLKQVGYDEMRRIIREDGPPSPSDRISTLAAESLSTISAQRASDPRKLRHSLRGELDWIVMKALEKDRSRRYEMASDFAADIHRYLDNQPVHACPPSVGSRFRNFARRHKAAFKTAAVGCALAGILLVATVVIIRINGNKIDLEVKPGPAAFDVSSHSVDISRDGKTLCYVDSTSEALVFRERDGAEQVFPTEEGVRRIHVTLSPDSKRVAYSRVSLKDVPFRPELRVIDRSGTPSRTLFDAKRDHICTADWSPDGKYILAVLTKRTSSRSEIMLVPVAGGDVRVLASIDSWPAPKLGGTLWRKMCFSPDGKYIVYDARTDANKRDLFLLDATLDDETPVHLEPHAADDYVLGWADSERVLFASNRNATWDAWVIRVKDGKAQGEPKLVRQGVGPISPIGFTDDGSYYYHSRSLTTAVYTAKLNREGNNLVAMERLQEQQHGYEAGLFAPDWSPEGKHLAYALSAPETRGKLNPPTLNSGHDEIFIRDEETGVEHRLRPEIGPIDSLQWFDDTSLFVDGKVVMDAQSGDIKHRARHRNRAVVWPDRNAIIYRDQDWADGDKIMIAWLETGREEQLLHLPKRCVYGLAISSDGQDLAFSSFKHNTTPISFALHTMPIDPRSPPKERLQLLPRERIEGLAWTSDGNDLLFIKAIYGEAMELGIWRVTAEGESNPSSIRMKELPGEPTSLLDLRIHPGGGRVTFMAKEISTSISAIENLLSPRDDAITIRIEE